MITCLTQLKNIVYGENIQGLHEEVIRISKIKGIVFGPHSVTFKQYLRLQLLNELVQKQKYD